VVASSEDTQVFGWQRAELLVILYSRLSGEDIQVFGWQRAELFVILYGRLSFLSVSFSSRVNCLHISALSGIF